MARPPKLFPAYRKHRGSGQAVVTINSRDHYLGPHGTKASKAQYDRLVMEWMSSGRSPSYGGPDREYAVIEMAADYLRYAKGHFGAGPRSTTAAMKNALRSLKDLYGRTPAADFGVLEFKAVRQSLMVGDRSRSYVNEIMQRIVTVFRWASAEGKLPASVPQNIAIIPGLRRGKCKLRETAPIQPVDDATVDATLPHLPAIIADMVRLQRLTGARPAEVCILRPCDLDRSGEVWLYRPESHKTEHHGRERTIYIGPKAQGVLLRYLARNAQTHCFRPVDSEAKRRADRAAARVTPISCGNRTGTNRTRKPRTKPGEFYDTAAYRRAIARGCDHAFPHPTLAGVPIAKLTPEQSIELRKWQSDHRWAPNQLRHATATEVRREFGLEAAQIVLGHASADVSQIYAERDAAKGLLVAKSIG